MGTIVDGGLGLELERRGFTYTTRLWSGEALLSRPDLLVAIHRDFLAAGARVIETATYQLAHATLRDLGYDDAAIDALFVRAVACARDAIATHVARDASANGTNVGTVAERSFIVAGSLGPYGATLGDGSEYTGAQHLSERALYAFHAERARSLALGAPDVVLFETIPTRTEALVVAEVARDLGLSRGWISLGCADGEFTYGGDRVSDIARELNAFDCIDTIGVNCTAPAAIGPLLRVIRAQTAKAILVCPNLGQQWETASHRLLGAAPEAEFLRCVPEWLELGAAYIGGCCGVGPGTIAAAAAIAAAFRFGA